MCLIHVTASAERHPHRLASAPHWQHTSGQDREVSHYARLLKQAQEQGESSISGTIEYLGHAVWCVPRQSWSPAMTAPVSGGVRG